MGGALYLQATPSWVQGGRVDRHIGAGWRSERGDADDAREGGGDNVARRAAGHDAHAIRVMREALARDYQRGATQFTSRAVGDALDLGKGGEHVHAAIRPHLDMVAVSVCVCVRRTQ